MVHRSQSQWSHQASNSKLHGTKVTHYIHTIKSCEQWRNDLSVILICFGHVLGRAKPLKEVIL
jgi:hypothetical protein